MTSFGQLASVRIDPEQARLRVQIDEAKSKLRLGGIYSFSRGYGASTAIMELCREFGAENCVVAVPNSKLMFHARNHWWWLFGSDVEPPIIIVWQTDFDDNKLRGFEPSTKLFIDGCDRMSHNGPSREMLQVFDFYAGVY